MQKYLLIAEKPSAMRAYRDCYMKHQKEIEDHCGFTIDFFAIAGHLYRNCEPKRYEKWEKKWRELYDEDLPMIPTEWKIEPIERSVNIIDDLKKKLREGYDGIIEATDSDVEGYGIYYLIQKALRLEKVPTLRFYETNLSDEKILESFLTMEALSVPRHQNAVNAFVFRSHWDWLIGMNFSTAYTVRYGALMRIGSVKAPTLKLIYDNCMAIDNFTEKVDYALKAAYKDRFDGFLIESETDKNERRFVTKEDAEHYAETLSSPAKVIVFDKSVVHTKAPKLYSLSALQVDAAKAYGYDPTMTLDTAQSLYETHKVLSYPRTSGNFVSSGQAKDFEKILNSLFGVKELSFVSALIEDEDIARVSKDKAYVNDTEVAKAAHDALIPTGLPVPWDKMTEAERNVFLLVARRFLSIFLPPLKEEKVVLLAETEEGAVFRSNGKRTLDQGYPMLYGKTPTDTALPEYHKGDLLDIASFEAVERKTAPPKRYSLGTIIDAMVSIAKYIEDPELKKQMKESEGIGTEATRAKILKDLEESGYIQIKRNMIYITDSGKSYIENLRQRRPDGSYDYGIADPVKIAYWSAKNSEIRQGISDPKEVMQEFESYLTETILKLKESGAPERSRASYAGGNGQSLSARGQTGRKCPICGGAVINGPYGLFCGNKKTNGCTFSIPNEMAGKKLTEKQKETLLAGKETQEISGFKKKDGSGTYAAKLKMDPETGKIKFVFSLRS